MYKANLEIHRRVAEHIGKYDTLVEIVKRKAIWSGRVVWAKRTLVRSILHVKGEGI